MQQVYKSLRETACSFICAVVYFSQEVMHAHAQLLEKTVLNEEGHI